MTRVQHLNPPLLLVGLLHPLAIKITRLRLSPASDPLLAIKITTVKRGNERQTAMVDLLSNHDGSEDSHLKKSSPLL
jgi:hypothetical protein